MKCAICHYGHTKAGNATIVLEREQSMIIIKHIPANICENCGEEYVSSEINQEILWRAEKAFSRGIMIELLDFAA